MNAQQNVGHFVRVLALLGVGLLGGCASVPAVVRGSPRAELKDGAKVAIAPAVALFEVPGMVESDAFGEGLFVGHLFLSGGYEIFATPTGQQYRSKKVEPSLQELYAKQAAKVVDEALAETLQRKGIPFERLTSFPAEASPKPIRSQARGSSEDDTRDNVNLPRFTLAPAVLDRSKLEGLKLDAQYLLVPAVAYYYSHNGGWFMGQTLGSPAGARFRVFWALYDLSSGNPVSYGDVEARHIEPRVYSPNSAQLEDYLLRVEKDLVLTLSDALVD